MLFEIRYKKDAILTISSNSATSAESNVVTLSVGTYYIKETKCPSKYGMNPKTYEVTITENHTASAPCVAEINNSIKRSPIELQKASANTNCTNGNSNYSLEGAEYTIYSDEACTKAVGKIVVDYTGYGISEDLPSGKYWVKETKASKGYALDPTKHAVTIP